MGDAFVRALMALENSQALPLEEPNGEANCPIGRIRIGIFFDGTGNNMWTDWKREKELNGRPLPPGEAGNGASSVVKLYQKYGPRQMPVLEKAYHHGVGADYDDDGNEIAVDTSLDPDAKPAHPDRHGNTLKGVPFGAGGKARIEWGLRMLAEFYSYKNNDKAKEKYYDVFGFSRGAALARDFANQVRTQRIANLKEEVSSSYFSLSYYGSVDSTAMTKTAKKKNYQPFDPNTITPKFMGIFDTVAMWGWGTGSFLHDVDHTYVEYCVHFVAEDEFRKLFPLSSIFMDPNTQDEWFSGYQEPRDYKRWMTEFFYPGCHSDIGGSYLNRSDIEPRKLLGFEYKSGKKGKQGDLRFIPLYDMYRAMKRAKVPIQSIPKPTGKCVELYEKYCAYRQSKDWANHVEQGQSQYIHWYENQDFLDRFYGPTGIRSLWVSDDYRDANADYLALRETYIHDSASEMTGSWLFGEKASEGERLRLQRKVIPAAAQPKYQRRQPVRPHGLPKR